MDKKELEGILESTFDDRRLSRGESKALREWMEEHAETEQDLHAARSVVFDLTRRFLEEHPYRDVVDWLEDVMRIVIQGSVRERPASVSACFSPGLDCLHQINDLIHSANRSIDICVFTITDDRISRQIRKAHERGVSVRIISDNEKAEDRGSDIDDLERAGISVVVDRTEHHMHHKFAVFDRRIVLTGSYNWTRSAAEFNHENTITSDDPRLVGPFSRHFDDLWNRLSV